MVKTETQLDVAGGTAEDMDGGSDDDPGSSCLHVLTDYEGWNALPGAEQTVRLAYDACVAVRPEIDGRELSVLLSSDEYIAELNRQYRGKVNPTNVLSFPAADGPMPPEARRLLPLGDIIIAYETLTREAGAEGKPPLAHLAHLSVHGILHLAGFDHETDSEAERMEALEREILVSMDVADPYSETFEEQPTLQG